MICTKILSTYQSAGVLLCLFKTDVRIRCRKQLHPVHCDCR